ncbi:hypothetical protein [Gramella sp. KN1008]|uniref:hypothetical protein n=1 Tax=Gramella sp. KN1008 TaxID=2529298 RepID=UPI00103E88CE|nr:hypothetical protein [Gramella sp. KN1008]TBW30050.1 hypothetical protein EZJ28_01210 [Gramella sp. KN1008]
MKFKYILTFLFISLMYWQGISQNTTDIRVFDYEDRTEFSQYEQLNLDKDHPNLLNPEISKNEMDKVIASWTELHQNIGQYLQENDFEWQVEDSEIMIVHKFYFNPDGSIHSYFFKMLNEGISASQRKKYSELVTEFAKTQKIGLTKDFQFAQCGKTKYPN